jgi:hypothetical protein
MELTWDAIGERRYETGVDHGVLYLPDNTGDYTEGVAWNGLTTVTESPSGADSNPTYADNIKYLNLISLEEFGATVEAIHLPARVRSVRWHRRAASRGSTSGSRVVGPSV